MKNESKDKNILKEFIAILNKSVFARVITAIFCLSFVFVMTYLIIISIPIISGFLHTETINREDSDIDENIEDWNGELSNKEPVEDEELDSESIKVLCHESIPLKADTEEVDITLINPGENNCYFIISVFSKNSVSGEFEELFKSKMIPPGKCLNKVKLNKKLSAGTHIAFIRYEAFAMDTLLPLNILESEVKLLAS